MQPFAQYFKNQRRGGEGRGGEGRVGEGSGGKGRQEIRKSSLLFPENWEEGEDCSPSPKPAAYTESELWKVLWSQEWLIQRSFHQSRGPRVRHQALRTDFSEGV